MTESLEDAQLASQISESDLKGLLRQATDAATECIEQRERDYTYKLRNASSVENMVLELVDSCYVSFDE